ncbi:MAG: transposase [Phycisphaerales bacterium]|nr:transposase [Phycisphaerales bacterium]
MIGDKAYDSDKLDEELAQRGMEMIAPHRGNRKPENVTQDRLPLQRAKRRWTVERTISWIQNYRRLCIRWEKSSCLFSGFLHMTCTLLLLSEVLR